MSVNRFVLGPACSDDVNTSHYNAGKLQALIQCGETTRRLHKILWASIHPFEVSKTVLVRGEARVKLCSMNN